MNRLFFVLGVIALSQSACKNDSSVAISCEGKGIVIADYQDSNGNHIQIFENGEAYIIENSDCKFATQYFEPDFYDQHYVDTDSGTFIKVDATTVFKPHDSFEEPFEGYADLLDVLITSADQRDRIFSQFTLQSPSTPEVSEYLALQNCIIDKTCDFIDNRIDLITDPTDSENTVLKFYSVAPTAGMVVSKCSISSGLVLFRKGEELWYEAKYYLVQGRPTTLVDFESSHFFGSPGPRIIFRGDQLAMENKFMDKKEFLQRLARKSVFL